MDTCQFRTVEAGDEMALLGVNIDHVATVRQARNGVEPDPVWAASEAELGGADGITIHLREDRRHIQERDLRLLKETVTVKLNLEIACEPNVVDIALDVKPDQVCLVPERREEVTTEGGLDVAGSLEKVTAICQSFAEHQIDVSLFIDPDPEQIVAASQTGAPAIELHTGQYALSWGKHSANPFEQRLELKRLIDAGEQATSQGLVLNAGHGLNYQNVGPVASIPAMHELNIGHSIVSRAIFSGMRTAVAEMKRLIS